MCVIHPDELKQKKIIYIKLDNKTKHENKPKKPTNCQLINKNK